MNPDNVVARSFATVREMLRDRGHDCPELADVDIHDLATSKPIFSIDAGGIRIIYNLNIKFRMADVRKLLDDFGSKGGTVILVSRDKISSTNLKQLADFEGVTVDAFDVTELVFNISKHTLVPLHQPIRDPADIKAVVDTYRLKSIHQLPLIQRTDAMARYLGLRPGQLVKITRSSPTSGEYVLYRCCV